MKNGQSIAERLVADEPALLGSLDFGAFVAQGTGHGPSLLVGDQTEINLFSSAPETSLDYRMSHLASAGDIVLVRKRDADFETYLAEHVGVENVTFLEVAPTDNSCVARLSAASPVLNDGFAEIAAKSGGLTLKFYLTTGHVWRLAQTIGRAAQQVVHVCGPSPRVTTRCNDKLWFAQLTRSVLGKDAIPPTMSAYGPAATAALVSRISKTAPQVIVKVPDSAGSAGNVRVSSAQLSGKTITETREFLLDRLHATGWQDRYPVLVGVWDENVTSSPSVQMWIPKIGEGQPCADGVFEQRLLGDMAAYVGAAKSCLPEFVQCKLICDAKQFAAVLQQIGYYGRCSFDAVICADENGRDAIHWIECNGRWGGVSIPMTAVNSSRVLQSFEGLLILQETLQDRRINTADMLRMLDDLLFRHSAPASGIIVLSPPTAIRGTMVNWMIVAETQAEANELSELAISRLRSAF